MLLTGVVMSCFHSVRQEEFRVEGEAGGDELVEEVTEGKRGNSVGSVLGGRRKSTR